MRLVIVVTSLMTTLSIRAQEADIPKVSFGFSMGYLKVIPGERFTSTDAGYLVDMYAHLSVKPGLWVGAGWSWGASPSVEAPEYDIFEPRDHPIWFETTQYYLSIRREYFKNPGQVLRPFVSGRIGWETEFSEYSGPTVERSGLLLGATGGMIIQVSRWGAFELGPMLTLVRLGDAVVFEEKTDDTSTGGSFFGLKGGFEFRF